MPSITFPYWLKNLPIKFKHICTPEECLQHLENKTSREFPVFSKRNSYIQSKFGQLLEATFKGGYIDPIDYTFFLLGVVEPVVQKLYKKLNLELKVETKNKKLAVVSPYFTGKPYTENIAIVRGDFPSSQSYYYWDVGMQLGFNKSRTKIASAKYQVRVNLLNIKTGLPKEKVLNNLARDLVIFVHELIHLAYDLITWKIHMDLAQIYKNDWESLVISNALVDVYNEALAYNFAHFVLFNFLQKDFSYTQLQEFIYTGNLRSIIWKITKLIENPDRFKRFTYGKQIFSRNKQIFNRLKHAKTPVVLVSGGEIAASDWGGHALSFYLQFYKQARSWQVFDRRKFNFDKVTDNLASLILRVYNQPKSLIDLYPIVFDIYTKLKL